VTFEARLTNVVEVDPVPPLAMGSVPVTFEARLTNVVEVDPVPPEAMGSAAPRVNDGMWSMAVTTSVPLL
jgi:hypothetical protein